MVWWPIGCRMHSAFRLKMPISTAPGNCRLKDIRLFWLITLGLCEIMMFKRILNYCRWQLRRLVQALDRDGRKYHEESVKFQQLMAANNEMVFEQMYSDPQLLKHYLLADRLDFYRQVAPKT